MSVLTTEEYRVALVKTNFLLERPRRESTSENRRKLRKIKTLLRVAAGAVARSTLAELERIIASFPEETKEELTQLLTTRQEQVAVSNVPIGTQLLDLSRRDLGYMTNEFVDLIYGQLLSIDSYQPSEQIVGVIQTLYRGDTVDPQLIRHFVLSYYRKVIDILLPVIGPEESRKLHAQVTDAQEGVFEVLNEFIDGLELDQPIERSLNEVRIVGGRRKTIRKRKRKVTRKRR